MLDKRAMLSVLKLDSSRGNYEQFDDYPTIWHQNQAATLIFLSGRFVWVSSVSIQSMAPVTRWRWGKIGVRSTGSWQEVSFNEALDVVL